MAVVVCELEDLRRVVREELRALSAAPRSQEDRRVTTAEAASAAGVGVGTIRAWAAAGKLKRYGEGRGVRYSLAEVLAVTPETNRSELSPEAWAERKLRKQDG